VPKKSECKKANGNCTLARDLDGLPVQCVGAWAEEKHDYVERYIAASSGARSKFARGGQGGLCYVDLFAGPGRAYIAKWNRYIDGTPAIAIKTTKAPFTRLVFCDMDHENAETLRDRYSSDERVRIVEGDCNAKIDEIASHIPKSALSLALIDPFGASVMSFDTIARLAKFPRMDLIVHFPTMGIKRNLEKTPNYARHVDRLLGTSEWQRYVKDADQVVKLISMLKDRLAELGYIRDDDLAGDPAFKNDEGGILYHLFFASKDPLGYKLWKSLLKTAPSGQKRLF
jgi:three-Cys-motif partner protein